MADETPGRVAATLAGIRERAEYAKEYMQGDPMPPSLDDVPRLLAAVEAALKLVGEWEAKAKQIGGQISLEDCDGAVAGFKMIGYQNHRDHAAALREAIGAALTGTQPGEDGDHG